MGVSIVTNLYYLKGDANKWLIAWRLTFLINLLLGSYIILVVMQRGEVRHEILLYWPKGRYGVLS